MEWFRRLRNHWIKRRVTDARYLKLFDENSDEIVVFDTETTSLDPKTAELLSIGAVKVKKSTIKLSDRFEVVVRPEGEIDAESIKIHHLRHCDVEHGLSAKEAIEQFVDFIGGRCLAGYYLEFDRAMIDKYLLKLAGIRLPNRGIEVSALYYDYKIGRIPQGYVDLRFDTIMEDLKLPRLGKHDALNDAIMTALILIKLRRDDE
ncbi:MAG: 3'-5' exonuclease [Campylobacterales bacterium]